MEAKFSPANGKTPNASTQVKIIDELYTKADLGVSSEAVIRALDPILDQRLGLLINKLSQCKPELGPLLEVKAEILEVWRMRRELKNASVKGKQAWEVIQQMFSNVRQEPTK